MSDSREVFAFPEALCYIWTGNSSGILAYAQSIDITVENTYSRRVFFTATGVPYGSKTVLVQTDKKVSVSIGALYAGVSLYTALAAGANISATVNFQNSADYASSTFTIWSAKAESFNLKGSENNIWNQSLKLISPDVSGL